MTVFPRNPSTCCSFSSSSSDHPRCELRSSLPLRRNSQGPCSAARLKLRRHNHSVKSNRVLGLTSSEDLPCLAPRRAPNARHVPANPRLLLPAVPPSRLTPGLGKDLHEALLLAAPQTKCQHARALPHLSGDRGKRPLAGTRRRRECGCGSYLICSASRLCCADRFPRDFDSAAQEWEQQNLQQQIEGRAA